MSTMPDHLRPITVEIPVTWTAEQALAVWEMLDQLREKIWSVTAANCKICWPRSSDALTSTTVTRVVGLATSNTPDRPAPEPPTAMTILLFDQDGHPAVPTCAHPRRRAQRQSRMPAGHRRRRRAASWTAASTTAFSLQRRTTMRPPNRCRPPRADQDASFRRGFAPPLTLGLGAPNRPS